MNAVDDREKSVSKLPALAAAAVLLSGSGGAAPPPSISASVHPELWSAGLRASPNAATESLVTQLLANMTL